MARSESVTVPPSATTAVATRLDPRWKLAAAIVAIAAVLLLRGWLAAAAALLAMLALAFAAGLSPRWLLARLGAALLAVAPFAVSVPFLLTDAGARWQFGPLSVSIHGIGIGFVLTAKALTIVTATSVLLATTPIDSLLKAAHSLGVPGLIVQVGALAYRYLFVFSDELRRIRVAVRTRGFVARMSSHSYSTAGRVMGTLLVRGHERGERVHQAMWSRGFDGRYRSLTEFHTRRADLAVFGTIVGVAIGLTVIDRVIH